jgi:DNA-binding transcriptional ArsR family regulator
MKPLLHPSIEDIAVEGILYALSDPVRMAIYASIVGSDGSSNCTSFLKVSAQDIPKSTLSQHFKALREAGLIRSERHGVEMRNAPRCAELDQRFPGLIGAIAAAYKIQAAKRDPSGAKKRKAGR